MRGQVQWLRRWRKVSLSQSRRSWQRRSWRRTGSRGRRTWRRTGSWQRGRTCLRSSARQNKCGETSGGTNTHTHSGGVDEEGCSKSFVAWMVWVLLPPQWHLMVVYACQQEELRQRLEEETDEGASGPDPREDQTGESLSACSFCFTANTTESLTGTFRA